MCLFILSFTLLKFHGSRFLRFLIHLWCLWFLFHSIEQIERTFEYWDWDHGEKFMTLHLINHLNGKWKMPNQICWPMAIISAETANIWHIKLTNCSFWNNYSDQCWCYLFNAVNISGNVTHKNLAFVNHDIHEHTFACGENWM